MAVPVQAPEWQESSLVQALSSSHVASSATLVNTQPVAASHVSVVQALLSLHAVAAPVQAPASQESLLVQAFPSLQLVPSARAVKRQPVVGSQSVSVQGLPSSQGLLSQMLGGHAAQLGPQSIPLSSPSFTPFVQCDAKHTSILAANPNCAPTFAKHCRPALHLLLSAAQSPSPASHAQSTVQ